MRLKFLGANRQVTGSCYYLEVAGKRLMVDCGMFQEREFLGRNWDPTPIDVKQLDALLLTHAHLDHCGLVPKLVREGFRGRIIATEPTVDLAQLVMNDSARIQEQDIEYKKRRHRREKRKSKYPYVPLYTREDAERVAPLMKGVGYDEEISLGPDVTVRYREAGHILGSALLEIDAKENGKSRRIVFSGDIGQWDVPIVGDPTMVKRADYVIMESTYGDKDHERPKEIEEQLAETILDTLDRGGNIVIPTFAIERAQELMLYVAELVYAKRIPRVMAFLDSPMAVNATDIFRRHPDFMDEKMQAAIESGRLASSWEWLKLVRSVDDSKAINTIRGTCIILAGSGMCTGGRIKHHLIRNLGRPESTILFVGYQARNTLGRQIVEGRKKVRIFGSEHEVRAKVLQVQGLSAHAGRSDLLRWLGEFERPASRLMLTHGEESTALELAGRVRDDLGWNVSVPEYLDEVEL